MGAPSQIWLPLSFAAAVLAVGFAVTKWRPTTSTAVLASVQTRLASPEVVATRLSGCPVTLPAFESEASSEFPLWSPD